MRKKRNGFTLIELLAVITILGIVIAIAVPGVTEVIRNSRKKTFINDANTFANAARIMLSANKIRLPRGDKSSLIITLDRLDIDRKPSSFSADWDLKKSYVLIYNEKTEKDPYHAYYVALSDTKGNSVELTKAENLKSDYITQNANILEIGTGFLKGSINGLLTQVPSGLFSSRILTNQVRIYSGNNDQGTNLYPADKVQFANWTYYQGATVETKKAPLSGSNMLNNSSKADLILMSSNNSTNYPIKTEYITENGIQFQRVKRTNPTVNPTILSLYSNLTFNLLNEDIKGKEVTVSFYARTSQNTKTTLMVYEYSPNVHKTENGTSVDITTEWKRYSFTFLVTEGASTGLRVNPYTTTIKGVTEDFYLDIYGYSVEPKNNSANSWQPTWSEMSDAQKPGTYFKTTGGTSSIKIVSSVGTSVSGTTYKKSIYVKNVGVNPMIVSFNSVGTNQRLEPGEAKYIETTGVGNGTSSNQIQFRAINIEDSLEFIAYNPRIEVVN